MDDYSIWKDFFDTIQSFPDWLKLLLALIPPALIAILTHQYYSYRLRRAAIDHAAAAAAASAAAAAAAAAAAMSLPWQESGEGLLSDQQRVLLDQPDSFLRDRAGRKDEDDFE